MNSNEEKRLSKEDVKLIEKNATKKIRLIEKTLFDTVKDCQSQLNQLRNDTAILISKIHAEVKEAKEKFNEGRECEHEWERKRDKWISVEDQPLFTYDRCGNMICTEEGSREFIAAVPYVDRKQPDKELWWIRHCTIEDGTGLCVVGDIENESSGWQLEHITHWQPLPEPPKQNS